eukprot:768542-Hanusia_phi.AAC.2
MISLKSRLTSSVTVCACSRLDTPGEGKQNVPPDLPDPHDPPTLILLSPYPYPTLTLLLPYSYPTLILLLSYSHPTLTLLSPYSYPTLISYSHPNSSLFVSYSYPALILLSLSSHQTLLNQKLVSPSFSPSVFLPVRLTLSAGTKASCCPATSPRFDLWYLGRSVCLDVGMVEGETGSGGGIWQWQGRDDPPAHRVGGRGGFDPRPGERLPGGKLRHVHTN